MRKYLREKGITLIALVVTIVVLLILAGVSISKTIGNNSLVSKTKQAKKNMDIGKEKEYINLSYASAKIDKNTKDVNKQINAKEMQDELDKLIGKGKTRVVENRSIKSYI